MKKQYPPTITMGKRLITVAIAGLGLLIAIIIYNLCHSPANAKQASVQTPAVLPDTANRQDTAWFNEPKTTPPLLAHLPIATHPLPIHLISTPPSVNSDSDQRAIQAPISSNQILAESEKTEPDHTNTPAITPENSADLKPDSASKDQLEKKTFLNTAETVKNYLPATLQNPRSPYEIKTGTLIPAILISGINSDLPGPITAQVRENVFDSIAGRYLLIPQGSRLQGIYDSAIAYGQQRVLIAWQRLIFPNGQSLELAGMPGVDVSGYAGFKDKANNHYQRLFGSAILMSMISAGLQLSQPQQSNDNNQPSVNQVLAQNVGISLSQTTDQLLRKNLNIQPTLEIRPGYLFNISVTQDILFGQGFSAAYSEKSYCGKHISPL